MCFVEKLVKEYGNFSDSVKYQTGVIKMPMFHGLISECSEIAQFVHELSRFPNMYNMSKTGLNIPMDPTLGPIKTPFSFVLQSKKVSDFFG